MERGPGPARYGLPSLTGSVGHSPSKYTLPAYSFGRKVGLGGIFKKDFSPGPVHYIDPAVTYRGRDGTPRYSISGRHRDLEPFKAPGPGAYAPEKKPVQGEKSAPAYSMGSRTRYRKRDANPSPNSYSLPILLGPRIPNRASSACYSLGARQQLGSFDTDYAKTPGPARYRVTTPEIYQRKAPAYSMLSRSFMPGDVTKKPGPGAHSPEKCTITRRSMPSHSMGIRHSEYICPLIIDVSD